MLCILATDEEDLDDIALQIHFTLLQAFCCDNDINILRVSGLRRLAQVLDESATVENSEPRDFHCILVTVSRPNSLSYALLRGASLISHDMDLLCIFMFSQNSQCQPLKCQALKDVGNYCEESRCKNQWIPYLSLEER